MAVEKASNAMQTLERKRLDLVVTDVVLPGGMSGPEFADQARSLYPDLKFIFMSGYPEGVPGDSTVLSSKEVLLSKPFRKEHLSKAIGEALK